MLTLPQAVGQGSISRGFKLSCIRVAPAVAVPFFFDLISAPDRNHLTGAPSALKVPELLAEASTSAQRQQGDAEHRGDGERHATSSLERPHGLTYHGAATYEAVTRR